MNPQLVLVNKLIKQSEQLLSLAELDQWDEFQQAEKGREATLKMLNLRDDEFNEQQLLKIKQRMAVLIDLNNQLALLSTQQRDAVADKIRDLRKGGKATQAYKLS